MSGRSFIVTTNGTLERMPAPIVADSSSKKRSDDMKIVIPKAATDIIQARLRSSTKYVQNNTANSLNIRDYIDGQSLKRKEREESKVTERISYNLRQQWV